jgi:hypothetical protein
MISCFLEESLFLLLSENAGMPTPGEQISIGEKPFLGMVGGMPNNGVGKVQTQSFTSQRKCPCMFSARVHGSAFFCGRD